MFKFKLTPDGEEPFEVVSSSRDVLQWERTTPKASMTKLREDMKMIDLYRIAHLAALRQGKYTGSEKDFMATVDLTTIDDEDDEADPTHRAASTDS